MDPISDMLIRIKNSQAVLHPTVNVPFSRLKFALAKILEKENFLGLVEKKGKGLSRYIKIHLKYQDKQPVIHGLKRISRPGQRIYASRNQLRPIKQGYGLVVLSTSLGLMADKEARQKGVGGEILCEIW